MEIHDKRRRCYECNLCATILYTNGVAGEEQRSRNRKIFGNSLHLLLLRPFNFNNQSGEDVKYAETTFQV